MTTSVPAAAVIPADPLDLLPRDARIAVAMSGGVDSSVAAARCVAAGFNVTGITLAMWPRDRVLDRDRGCCSVDAVDDARRVAARLGIRHYAWNLEDEFRDTVIAEFEAGYAAGITPNPCVRCNERIKFGALLDRAREVGATHIATGHYARLGRRGEAVTLHRAIDEAKDQAYTLHRLSQEQLAAAVFPLGSIANKAAVRAEAAALGLGTAAKPDSQELCFVDGSIHDELSRRLQGRFAAGNVVDASGTVIGSHDGVPFYTVGQRSGLHVDRGIPDAKPLHVISVNAATNTVVAGPREAMLRRTVSAEEWNWASGEPAAEGTPVQARLRAHGSAEAATISRVNGAVELTFDPPVAQVAPGQSVVAYSADGAEVLGGGIIVTAA